MAGQVFRGKVPNNSRSLFQLASKSRFSTWRNVCKEGCFGNYRGSSGGGGCGAAWPKGEEREREHVQKFLWGSFNVPYFALLFTWLMQWDSNQWSRGRRLSEFGHRSLIPHLTMVLLQNDKTWKNLTLSPKKGTRSLCRDCSWLKRGGLWRPKSQEGRENREPFVGPTNSWCSHHRRESVRVSWAQDGRCWRLVGKSALW